MISTAQNITLNNNSFVFLPYITEANRKKLLDYLPDSNSIILSHNDIAGFNFGGFISKEGFHLDEINKNCKLFLNGHLHNSDWLSEKVLNVGNLCGQNFSENAFKYKHGCWILDTETNKVQFFENPFAFNFYQIEYPKQEKLLEKIKNNSVLNIKCERSELDNLNKQLSLLGNKISAQRVTIYDKELDVKNNPTIKIEKVDHLKQLTDYVHVTLGNTQLINEELKEICK